MAPPRSLALLAALAAGCALGHRPVALPDGDGPALMVLSAPLDGPLHRLGRHSWIAIRDPAGWQRWEVQCCPGFTGTDLDTVRASYRAPLVYGVGSEGVRLHGVFVGAEAERMIACLRREAVRYPDRHRYLTWPGPNSNTFVDWILRRCAIAVDLPPTGIGKDHRGSIGASLTAGRTGVQIETPLVGIKLGLTEGVELHLLGMTWGIDLWPPALLVPLGGGRIGFDDR